MILSLNSNFKGVSDSLCLVTPVAWSELQISVQTAELRKTRTLTQIRSSPGPWTTSGSDVRPSSPPCWRHVSWLTTSTVIGSDKQASCFIIHGIYVSYFVNKASGCQTRVMFHFKHDEADENKGESICDLTSGQMNKQQRPLVAETCLYTFPVKQQLRLALLYIWTSHIVCRK